MAVMQTNITEYIYIVFFKEIVSPVHIYTADTKGKINVK